LKSKSAAGCRIKNCEKLRTGKFGFCFECEAFPCEVLKRLDKRYRTQYAMSMIDNLEIIRRDGLTEFIGQEKWLWACPECGRLLCVHKEACVGCGLRWRARASRVMP
jgi:hypothetical protein